MRIIIAVLLLVTISKPAFAYIDVAIGSLVLQSLIAGFVAFGVMWRGWVYKIKSFFGKGEEAQADGVSEAKIEE